MGSDHDDIPGLKEHDKSFDEAMKEARRAVLESESDEHAANLAAHLWAAGADHETAAFVAKQLLKKGLWLVPDRATEAMWQAGRSADEVKGDSYSKIYLAMIEAAPRA